MKTVTIDVLQQMYLSEGNCEKLDDETLFLEKNYYFGRGTVHMLNDLTAQLNAYPEIEMPVLVAKRLYPSNQEDLSVYWFSKQREQYLLRVVIREIRNNLTTDVDLCEQKGTTYFAHDYPLNYISEQDKEYIDKIVAPLFKQCVLECNAYRLRYITGEIS